MATKPLVSKTYPTPKTSRAAFDQGQAPIIGVVNAATVPLGYDLTKLVASLQKALDTMFAKVWTCAAGAQLQIYKTAKAVPATAWAILLTDTADVAGALGYHDLSAKGLPVAPCFVKTTIDDGGDIAVTISHELWEMLVDPGIQMWAQDPTGRLQAYETADAVEETDFLVDGVRISNFVHPAWFEGFRKAKSAKFDHLGLCAKPFQLLKGGYSIVMQGGKEGQIFGSAAKEKRFNMEDRTMHRSMFRRRSAEERKAYIKTALGKS